MDESTQSSHAHDDSIGDHAAGDGPLQLDELAESFVGRLRRGERPSIQEYVDRFPELAAGIRELFPTLAMLEQAGGDEGRSVSAPFAPPIPRQLGEYQVIRELGRGGMGVVYEAEHATMRRRVALKILPAATALDATHLRRFHHEARAAGRLHHTNIVPVFEVGLDQGLHYYAMQYIEGQSLDLVIDALRRLRSVTTEGSSSTLDTPARDDPLAQSVARSLFSGQFASGPGSRWENAEEPGAGENAGAGDPSPRSPPRTVSGSGSPGMLSTLHESSHVSGPRDGYFQRVARIGLQVADALAHSHSQGVLHRDIKPSNLILDSQGVVWVTDFGLAKHDNDNLTRTGDLVGTLRYMAPERMNGQGDARSDIYGVGLTLYELCTLRPAFDHPDRAQVLRQIMNSEPPSPRKLVQRMPHDLETIILKSIDKQPSRRYPSAEKLAEDLRLFLADRPIAARRASMVERTWRFCRRNPYLSSLGSVVALLLMLLVAASLLFAWNSGRQARRLADKTRLANELLFRSESLQAGLGPTGRPGQRTQRAAAVGRAMAVLPSLELPSARRAESLSRLRNDLIASLGRVDLWPEQTWPEWSRATAVEFDARFERFAAGDESGRITVRHVEDREQSIELDRPGLRTLDLRFSLDGRYLAAIYVGPNEESTDVTQLAVWDLHQRKAIIAMDRGLRYAPLAFHPDSAQIAVGTEEEHLLVYSLDQPREPRTLPIGFEASQLVFHPSGRSLFAADQASKRLHEIDSQRGNVVRQLDSQSMSLALTLGRNQLVAAGFDGNAYLWPLDGPHRTPIVIPAHRMPMTSAFLNDRGDRLVTESKDGDGTVRVWDVASQRELLRLDSHRLAGRRFAPDDQRLALRGPGGEIGLWRLMDNQPLQVWTRPTSPNPHSWAATFCPRDDRFFVLATREGVEFWDTAYGQKVGALETGTTAGVAFSPDGGSLFTSGKQGIARWLVEFPGHAAPCVRIRRAGTIIDRYTGHVDIDHRGRWLGVDLSYEQGAIADLASPSEVKELEHFHWPRVRLSPDGVWAVTTSAVGKGVRIWRADALQRRENVPHTELERELRGVQAHFSPDGQWLATAAGGQLALWHVATWQLRQRIRHAEQDDWTGPLAFSPDSRVLACARSRYQIQLVDVLSGHLLARLESPFPGTIGWLGFHPAGTRLLATIDQDIHVWDLQALRDELQQVSLDWSSPAYPRDVEPPPDKPLVIEVVGP
jgi:serine/threonine protein kinase/WD40 repeat protein